MDENDSGQARRLALLALALDEPAPAPGARPALDELYDWMTGAVAADRAAEIRAHVARDPEVHADWQQLRRAVAEGRIVADGTAAADERGGRTEGVSKKSRAARPIDEERLTRLRTWLSTAPLGGAFATAAVLIVAIGVSRDRPPDEFGFWHDWQVAKSSGSGGVEQEERAELRALLAGMREQMSALSLEPVGPHGATLPESVEACTGDDGRTCPSRRAALRELGRLSVLAHRDCLRAIPPAPERRHRVGELLETLADEPSIARLAAPLRRWAAAGSPPDSCGAVGTLIARALAGHDDGVR